MPQKWSRLNWFDMAHVIVRKTHTIDATNQVLGRLATRVATLLMGKHKAAYVSNVDMGDTVHIVHALNVVVTGRKEEQKEYKHYTGYPGGLRTERYAALKVRKPEAIIRKAVMNMLPHNRLRTARLKRLTISV